MKCTNPSYSITFSTYWADGRINYTYKGLPFIIYLSPPERLTTSQCGVDAELCKGNRKFVPAFHARDSHYSVLVLGEVYTFMPMRQASRSELK